MSTVATPMTTDEFLSLPDHDRFERWLVEGELRERPMSLRSPHHSVVMARSTRRMVEWEFAQPEPRPLVCTGDAYFRLRRNPDTNVGIDIAVATSEQAVRTPKNARLIDGSPVLAVEILSASDMIEDIQEKVEEFLKNGTRIVWLADPFQETVTVYRPNAEPALFSRSQNLVGDPELAGLTISVAEIFR